MSSVLPGRVSVNFVHEVAAANRRPIHAAHPNHATKMDAMVHMSESRIPPGVRANSPVVNANQHRRHAEALNRATRMAATEMHVIPGRIEARHKLTRRVLVGPIRATSVH